MGTSRIDASLDQLYRDAGFRPLSHWWGRAEMVIGLTAMALGAFGMILVSTEVLRQTAMDVSRKEEFRFPTGPVVGCVLLFVLGGYFALAGHRRHLYESGDRLAAYLADVIRSQMNPAADRPAVAAVEPQVARPAAVEPRVSPAGV